ncbi:hypothetical protein K2Z83_11845 [Oscillochloris sp. ZM17-4]|uniref:hypothetical protein n=1 Tax=Oscillochloris sp. ZM17-4 TaxID=2866714 RepID=UPI001C73739E|nr:hypothetical protein [Oscillochloris sp. ZM17-4]MBX0328369.1 hypothetical protein [Oscillochloris sp. ZM17-4]
MTILDAVLHALSRDLLVLVGAGLVAALVAALLSPLGPLFWWSGWMHRPASMIAAPPDAPRPPADPTHYLVYLSGIGVVDAADLGDLELGYLRQLAARLPGCVIIHDVFIYAVDNVGLSAEHWLGGFWRWVRHSQVARSRIAVLGNLINLRNLLQMLVSADQRYGPLYSWGTAGVIARTLVAHGYRSGSGAPVTLIGYSGGAQIALGAARYLGPALGAPLQLITIGGVMSADPGLDTVEAVHQLCGAHDPMPRYGARCFPGRWPIVCGSPWNRACAAGKITTVAVGPGHHRGLGGYFDPAARTDGPSLRDRSVDATRRLVVAMIDRHWAVVLPEVR